jgi:hypothetical protein
MSVSGSGPLTFVTAVASCREELHLVASLRFGSAI